MSPFQALSPASSPKGKKIYACAFVGAIVLHVGFFALLGSGLLGNGHTPGNGENEKEKDGAKNIEVSLLPPPSDGLPEIEPLTVESAWEDQQISEQEFLPDETIIEDSIVENLDFTFESEIPVVSDLDLSQIPPSDITAHLNPDFSVTPVQTNKRPPRTNNNRPAASRNQGVPGGTGSAHNTSGGNTAGATAPRYKSAPKPPYPPSARQSGKEGTVRLKISLDASGTPTHVSIAGSSGHPELDQSAAQFVKSRWTFYPAQKDGNSVPWTVVVPVVFSLKSH